MAKLKGLRSAVTEKDVESAYRSTLVSMTHAEVSSPHKTDGLLCWGPVRLLFEAKYDLDFKSRAALCAVLGQCVMYVKLFAVAGDELPNVILVGDKNECLALATTDVVKFLDLDINWAGAPSKGNPALTRALIDDAALNPWVVDVTADTDLSGVVARIEALALGEHARVRATPHNIGAIFQHWQDRVFARSELSSSEAADLFLAALFKTDDVYAHPKKKGVLVSPNYPNGVPINREQLDGFMSHFDTGYTAEEVDAIYAVKDRLLEDEHRRRQGAFFTPELWVNEAHKTLEDVLGDDWKETCVVWDPAAGTGNLTRGRQFSSLILSTAEKSDVRVLKETQDSRHLTFQFDFLNEDAPSPFFEADEQMVNCLPASVHATLKTAAAAGKKLVFFMNPPYAEDGVAGAKGATRAGVATSSQVSKDIKDLKFGRASRQLYTQFMFKCVAIAARYGFKSYVVAQFSTPTFMTSDSYHAFRTWWYRCHDVKALWLFRASHFAGVSDRWGVLFSVWSWNEDSTGTDPGRSFHAQVKDVRAFEVVDVGDKRLYSPNGDDASSWVSAPIRGSDTDTPKFSSGLRVRDLASVYTAGQGPGALGVMCNKGNNVMNSGTDVYLLAGKPTDKGHRHFDLTPDNWRRAIALFAARKLVAETWLNQKDEYLEPHSQGTDAYELWVNDCHVYALLHPSNNCTAMRTVQYKDKAWTISNHMFWLSRQDVLAAFDTPRTKNLYRDCKQFPAGYLVPKPSSEPVAVWEAAGTPYMASLLQELQLSPDAQAVLDALTALWHLSVPGREDWAAGRPELHLGAWDAGVYALKHYFRDQFPAEWADLQAAYKLLSSRLRAGVYDHGFLKP